MSSSRRPSWPVVVLPALLLLLVFRTVLPRAAAAQERPRNVILFVSDGCGPASFTMARDFVRDHLRRGDHLALDEILVGTARTWATDSRVTDSAAGATAFASGIKTYNGAIGMDTLRRPAATVLEAAEARGLATGLVVTTRLTHATPAAFSAHVPERGMEAEIAAQQVTKGIDVLFGGGRRFYLPAAAGGSRKDGRNLVDEARAAGYTVALTRDDLRNVSATPVLGLVAMDNLAYEIDRDTLAEPDLAEMTRKAIDLLRGDPDGFFLMVEGSRIDHAAHENDAAAHLHDILAYDRAVAEALAFARADGATLVIGVSDHETGGLTIGHNYAWDPSALARVTASLDLMVEAVAARGESPEAVLRTVAGIDDLNEAERAVLARAAAGEENLHDVLAFLIADRVGLHFSTGGHTAIDVNLYAFGPGSERLRGNHENTVVGRVIADLMAFDLPAMSAALQE